jgi:hypothetical protein
MTGRRLTTMLVVLFIAGHAAYYAMGVRFDERPLTAFWQHLDVELLRNDLSRSLFYLHSQPPAWNLYLGLVLKAFPSAHVAVFSIIALALGLALFLGLVSLLRRLGASPLVAVSASTLFVLSPSFVLHEQLLFYAAPLATVLTLSAVLLDELARRGRAVVALAFYALLLVLATTWSLFHLAYLLLVTAGLLVLLPERRRAVTRAAIPAVLVLVCLYGKNFVVFGHFAPSTWVGMNLARITVRRLPRDARDRLIRARVLSPVAAVRPFAPLDAYPAAYEQVTAHADIACLRDPLKSTGEPNFNHLAYVALSEQYLRDSLAVVRHAPRAYLRGIEEAWLDYASSTSDSSFLAPNVDRAKPLTEAYDAFLYGRVPGLVLERGGIRYRVYAGLVVALPLAWIFGLWRAFGSEEAKEARPLVLYLCFNIAWVALVGNSLEVGENNRFRFVTDPLSVALLAMLAERLVERLRPESVRSGAGKPSAGIP